MKKKFYKKISAVFGIEVHVIFGEKRFQKYLKEFKLGDEKQFKNAANKGKAGVFRIDNKLQYVIAFHDRKPQSHVIVHEIVHIVDRIRKRYHIDDTEFNAYLTQHLYRQL